MERLINQNIERLKSDFSQFSNELSKGTNKKRRCDVILKDIEEKIKEIKSLFSNKPD